MSDGSGLILQQKSKSITLSELLLLVVADRPAEIEAIAKTLRSSSINCKYDTSTVARAFNASRNLAYSAIVYSYSSSRGCPIESPLKQLSWWYQLSPQIPLILITESLGDEIAVECIQAGISGYILKHKLDKLPASLENILTNCSWQESRIKTVRIQQQQRYIQQLEAANQQLKTAEAATEEHLSHLAHELRSPIAGIIGFARMLRDCIYGSLNPKQMQYACSIATTGEYLLELVTNYLDLAKIEANKEEIHLEKLVVEDICLATLSLVQEKVKAKGLKLIFESAEGVDFCYADPMRLKQILLNLLSNAVKFTAVGSVTLKVEPREKKLAFAVIDTGIGIAPGDRDKLFKAFQQLNNRHEGTGLGLVLSRKLAQLHGGDIVITSQLGKGSCFTLYLPLK
ncbi:ATP-binding protein [Myxosarcina sp. GI1(2024)]